MNLSRFTLVVICLWIAVLGGLPSAQGGGVCLAKPLHDLAVKHAKLYEWLYEIQFAAVDRITSKKRWKDKQFPLGEAQADLQASLARAHEVSLGSGGLGVETTKAQAEVFTGDRVCDSTKTPLEDAGAGIGHMVATSGLSDVESAALLRHIAGVGLPGNSIFGPTKMDVSIAEVTDAIRSIREAGVPIPNKMYDGGHLGSTGDDKGAGSIAEILIIGKDARSGVLVSGIDIDTINPDYNNTAIDYLRGATEMVQIGRDLGVIRSKLSDAEGMANRIRRAYQLEPNRRFVFTYLDPSGMKPTQDAIDRVNFFLQPLDATPHPLTLSLSDFYPVTSIP